MSMDSAPSKASIVSVVSMVVPLGAVPLRIRALAVTFVVSFGLVTTVLPPARSALTSIYMMILLSGAVHPGFPIPAVAWDAPMLTAKKTPAIQTNVRCNFITDLLFVTLESQIPDLLFAHRQPLPRKPSPL